MQYKQRQLLNTTTTIIITLLQKYKVNDMDWGNENAFINILMSRKRCVVVERDHPTEYHGINVLHCDK